jgi:hypothetical protein
MTLRLSSAVWVIVGLMAASFGFCILVPLLARADIPDLFADAVRSGFDTFATPLGAAIGFIFSAKFISKTPAAMPGKAEAKSGYSSVEIFAVLLVAFYCGVFDVVMLQFSFHRTSMESVITVSSQLRPYVAFLITAVIAFYFGAEKATRT